MYNNPLQFKSQSKKLIRYASVFLLAIVLCLFSACDQESPYKITSTSVGPLTRDTQVKDIKNLFKEDSIVNNNSNNGRSNASGIITVFEKGGTKLLSLIPATKSDTATIKTVQIFDNRYTTTEGISIASTFKEVQDNYSISKVESLLSTIIVFVDEINAYFTIDKKELPSELRVGPGTKVEAVQIPDNAKIKYFMIGW